jgi:hypothetical protein
MRKERFFYQGYTMGGLEADLFQLRTYLLSNMPIPWVFNRE